MVSPPSAPFWRRERALRRGRPLIALLSVLGHGAAVFALLSLHADPPAVPEAPVFSVALVPGEPKAPEPPPQPKPAPTPAKSPPRRSAHAAAARKIAPPTDESREAEVGVELSEADLAGASSADSGPSGGVCDMARWVQSALRRDPLAQAAVAPSGGRAIMVWNGDWVRTGGESGKGLAAVREAILWEVAFAPAACRNQSVRGLVLLSLGGSRLALGEGEWRWSDLLAVRGARPASAPLEP